MRYRHILLRTLLIILYAFGNTVILFAQQEDSVQSLSTIMVRAFEQNRAATSATAIVKIIDNSNGDRYNKNSLVNAFNTLAGVRMEERSPGSYRINIRGSSLRSPFGVRNVKVYWNDLPVTDPSGNTYFNQFAFNNFSSLEVFKGPASSLYGAGTGGLILMNNDIKKQASASIEYITGSYNLQSILAAINSGNEHHQQKISYAHNQSNGYREQSAMRRDNAAWTGKLKLSEKQSLAASVLYTDMYYQTPGALTLKEFNTNEKAARLAVGAFPSAVAAKAAIFQQTFLAGFTHRNQLNSFLQHTTTIYGAFAQIKNSAVRNYERRNEPHFGGRTVLTFDREFNNGNSLQWNTGLELQQGYFNIQVAKNKNGTPDSLQTNDDVNTTTYSIFTQATFSAAAKWFFTTGVSFNKSYLHFTRLSSYPVMPQTFAYKNELAPRLAVLKKFENDFSLLATISKGFSPPTIAELLPSTGIINTGLQAEHGWNYELTARQFLLHKKLQFEATGFYFDLKDALVQRRDAGGADYFTNAGSIRQKGLELDASYLYLPGNKKPVDYCVIKSGYTFNHFRYGKFVKDTSNFSGNIVPSVPANSFSFLADIFFSGGWYANTTYYAASKIFMNDANTATAAAYHLLGARAGLKKDIKFLQLNLYAGADNLLNEKYSLGNDINAVGGRYYNAAPRRNYYAGLSLMYRKRLSVQ